MTHKKKDNEDDNEDDGGGSVSKYRVHALVSMYKRWMFMQQMSRQPLLI